MNLQDLSDQIKDCEGIILDKVIYVKEDEVLKLVLKFAYGIEYTKPEQNEFIDI